MIYDVRCTQEVLVLREMSTIHDFIYHIFCKFGHICIYTQLRTLHIYIIICAKCLNSSYLGMTIVTITWWVENFGPGMAKADLWESTMAWSVAKRTTGGIVGGTGRKTTGSFNDIKKNVLYFFPGNRLEIFWKKIKVLGFQLFQISKVRESFQEFWRYIRLVDGFFEVLSDIFPWTMSHGKCEFFQNKRKDVCNKQVSFDVFNKSEFFQWFQFLILIFSPYCRNHFF